MNQTGQVPEHNARKLTTHQKAVLIQVLRTFPNERVEIRYAPDAHDAHSYAQDFMAVFKAIGWDVTGPEAEAPGNRSALVLLVRNAKLPACAEALRDALRIYEIAVETQCEAGSPAHTFTMWVGAASTSRG
ncbi:MAG: hypothetical protein WB723_08795 [Candidatus Acidiferrales bacterium]